MKIYATRKFEFEACHYLPNYKGDCANLHGHSYKLEVTFSRNLEAETLGNDEYFPKPYSMVIDFKEIDHIVTVEVLNDFDHTHLNKIVAVPTAEALAVNIYNRIHRHIELAHDLVEEGLKLEEVKLWETSNSYVTYRGEE